MASQKVEDGCNYCGPDIMERQLYLGIPDISVRPEAPEDSLLFDWAAIADSVVYHDFLRRAGIEGEVAVDIVVSAEGRLVAADVTPENWARRDEGGRALLIDGALAAVRSADYTPAPSSLTATRLIVRFRLR